MKPTACLLALLLPFLSMCQPINIKGKVINEDGEPIPAATITHNRTKQSVITDRHGEFTIDHSPLTPHDSRPNQFDSLLISATGYELKRLPIDHSLLTIHDPITVTLHREATTLQSVTLSTGYQEIPRERATGSFTKLDNEKLNLQAGLNILDRLEGLTNGVLFDKHPNRPGIMVRGLSSINGSKAPLIVLDNFPYEGDIANINPNDIESITILKDAAAASIWGTRAGNGVIVISTKKAKQGQPFSITAGSNIIITEKPDLFSLRQISVSDFIDVEQFLFGRGFYNNQVNNISRPFLSPVVETLIKRAGGQLTQEQAVQHIQQLKEYDWRSDYQRNFLRNAFTQQYNLGASGSAGMMSWLLSASFDKNNNELSAAYDRFNWRLQNTFRPSAKLTIRTSLLMTGANNKTGKADHTSLNIAGKRLYPYARLADELGQPLPLYMNRQPYIDTAGAGKLLDWKFYPLEDYRYNRTHSAMQQRVAVLNAEYRLGPGLSLAVTYQHEQQKTDLENLRDIGSFAARDLINRFSQLNRTTGIVKYNVPLGGILGRSYSSLSAHNAKAQLNYTLSQGPHTVAAIAGAEIRQARTKSESYQLYGYNPQLGTSANVDPVNPYPHFITGASAFIPSGNSRSEILNRFVAAYSNASYTFRNRYTVSASIRKDASNLFGVNANEKGVPLWSAGAAWNISNEKFFNPAFFRMLKLRSTLGFSGNVDNSRSAVTVIRYTTTAQFTNLPFAVISQVANPSLRWERVKMFNIGLDFEHNSGRFSGSIEWYHKRGLDLFGPAPVDYTTGVGNVLIRNIAAMKGKGLDLELNCTAIDRAFKWQQTLIFNYNDNRVTDYFQQSTQGSVYINSGGTISPFPGKPLYGILSYPWAGLDANGNPQGFLDGLPSVNYAQITGAKTQIQDLVFSGSAQPVFFGNFLNTFSWKNFSLAVNFNYKLGYYFRRESINYTGLFNSWSGHSDFSLRWQAPGDEHITTVPSMVYPLVSQRDGFYSGSEILVSNAGQIRLQFISLSCKVGNNAPGKKVFQQWQCFANAANLGLLWRANKLGLDPDYPSSVPPPRQFTIGVKTTL